MSGELDRVTDAELHAIAKEGLARRFGEHPDPDRLNQAVQLIRD